MPRWLYVQVMCVSVSHVKTGGAESSHLHSCRRTKKIQDGPRCPLAPGHRTCKLRSEFGTFRSRSETPERESCEASSQRGGRRARPRGRPTGLGAVSGDCLSPLPEPTSPCSSAPCRPLYTHYWPRLVIPAGMQLTAARSVLF